MVFVQEKLNMSWFLLHRILIMASTYYFIIEKQNETYVIHDLNKFELPIGNSVG